VSDLPSDAFTRGLKLAALPLSFAGRAAIGLGKRVGGQSAEMVIAEFQSRTADQMFKVLGELKGGAMKVGQALSVLEAALPEEIAKPYRATLTKLQEAAPPLPVERVHAVLAYELGPDWRADFIEFDDLPSAAASIGQVHKAIWHTGAPVAVKIQYPGADKALAGDLSNASKLAKLFSPWIPGLDLNPLLDELNDRIIEELDYLQEAEFQNRFAESFNDAEFAVPRVLKATKHVLVSEWLEGRPLSDIITNGTTAERDHAGALYQRFLLAGPARVGLLHADPHPGNFRITTDRRLGVLDYGAVARLPDGFPASMGALLAIAIRGDSAAVRDGLAAEGFIKPGVELDQQSLLAYLAPFTEPADTETFTYSREWMRKQFNRVNDPRNPDFVVGMKLNLPPNYLLIHRVWLGSIGVMCQLGATVPARTEIEKWLPGFSAA